MEPRTLAGGVILIILLVFLLPKGLLLPTDSKEVSFPLRSSGFVKCPFFVRTHLNFSTQSVEFTIVENGTPLANFSLRGVVRKHVCIPEGIFVYSYYPGDPYAGMYGALVETTNLTERWWREILGFPRKYSDGAIYLFKGGCVTLLNASTGRFLFRFCSDEPRSKITDVFFMNKSAYVTVVSVEKGPRGDVGKAIIYLVEKGETRKKTFANLLGDPAVVELRIDGNEEYVAVSYFMYTATGRERDGLCVFRADDLTVVGCKSFRHAALNVKVEGDTVYVKVLDDVKAYRIISP
jgi:outer membrane protein assembly factor BamB